MRIVQAPHPDEIGGNDQTPHEFVSSGRAAATRGLISSLLLDLLRAPRPVRQGRDRMGGVEIVCPYCGETIPVFVDEGGGPTQRYIEDCSVCCRPIEISVGADEDGGLEVVATRADE